MAKRTTVIDIGSNSVRMVVYEKTSRFAFHILHEAKAKVRLSEDAYQNDGNLQKLPMQRTYDALENFLSISSSLKSKKTLCVATSALRDAPNKKKFLQKVSKNLKLNIKIINGAREAYLGAVSCINLLPELNNALSIDIGGGSTEFSIINHKNIENTISLELGTVRLKELFFDKNKLEDAIKYTDSKLEVLDNLKVKTIVGIGGTFRAISSAIMKNSNYPLKKLHGYQYSTSEFINFIDTILNANETELKQLNIKSDRFDVIKPGSLILSRLIKKLSSVDNLITSGVGVREGVYLSDLLRHSKDRFPVNYNVSVRYLIDNHIQDNNFANQLNQLSKKLFDITYEYLGLDKSYRYELSTAAKLYLVGGNIHFYSQNKHSYYLCQSALEYGFTHKQIQLISTLTRYASKKFPSDAHVSKYKEILPKREELNKLSFLLSLTIALLSHKPRNIDFELKFRDGILNILTKKNLSISKEAIKKLSKIEEMEIRF
ncbi:MAG: Ppx/GppA phosphatase family protein [Campylobacterota bacterium]|nr:Ppx/GppA phosphatase family protein [Campylobacterota bacterium]